MGAVLGIFHLAQVSTDALMENQNADNFEAAVKAKIVQCEILDKVSRRFCPQLEYFITFSSIVSAKGNRP